MPRRRILSKRTSIGAVRFNSRADLAWSKPQCVPLGPSPCAPLDDYCDDYCEAQLYELSTTVPLRAPESNAAGVCAGSRTRMRRRVFFMPSKGSRFGARRPQRRLQRRRSRSAAAAAGLRSLKPEIANRNTSRLFPAFGVGASVGRSSGAPPAAHARARNAHLSRSAAA
jgi:hypothetical protein